MGECCLGRADKTISEPAGDRFRYLAPNGRGMGEMRIERVCQPDFAAAQFGKVAVGKRRIREIAEQPKIDIGPQCFDGVESQRWPVGQWRCPIPERLGGLAVAAPD